MWLTYSELGPRHASKLAGVRYNTSAIVVLCAITVVFSPLAVSHTHASREAGSVLLEAPIFPIRSRVVFACLHGVTMFHTPDYASRACIYPPPNVDKCGPVTADRGPQRPHSPGVAHAQAALLWWRPIAFYFQFERSPLHIRRVVIGSD